VYSSPAHMCPCTAVQQPLHAHTAPQPRILFWISLSLSLSHDTGGHAGTEYSHDASVYIGLLQLYTHIHKCVNNQNTHITHQTEGDDARITVKKWSGQLDCSRRCRSAVSVQTVLLSKYCHQALLLPVSVNNTWWWYGNGKWHCSTAAHCCRQELQSGA